ncbi:hypothetical protein NEUTE1DRAFT_99392 [Neurospora tetrasperma FGSC 2508]|uniref:HTH APSES-type domain-containing protein n=1 Tax=Neurospora tetrasperma (strain FGSC 2508 / ATCC MYA-4615 / P0657) TaxID=510951 RepID=F8MFI5_NEUT8|nr:uncharacterized protein NEUTE1DRAFT_99392 [Neurospora tetrasperma FGSC 2508]EGO59211.1 hypothetical protein NEUTE1DRAFT_99392 [Neurospora tetrasperma FGSC 2508]EGZ73323.1 hypothetical protein NEUTE2DRAFT_59709 [Neurospora tetrasperma FGSC 2509]
MLNQNPGLKDIAYSITGGAIKAQGYWMPYACAKAVCATFCYQIAGALIPLFGPDFPSECISPGEPRYGIMIIKPELISDTMRKAQELYQRYGNWGGGCTSSSPARRPLRTASSVSQERHHHHPYPNQEHRDRQQQQQRMVRSRRGLAEESSCVDAIPQLRGISAPMPPAGEWTPPLLRSNAGRPCPVMSTSTHSSISYPERAPHRSAWTAVNHQPPNNSLDRYSLKRPLPSNEPDESVSHSNWPSRSQAPNPWLTAIPRSPRKTSSSPWASQPGSANRSRAGSINSMASQHPQGLPSPSLILSSPSSSMVSRTSSNSPSPRPQLPPISKLCSLPVPSGRRRLPNGRPSRVGGDETSSHSRQDHSTRGAYQFSAGYQRALTPPSSTSAPMHWRGQRRPSLQDQHEHEHILDTQPRRIAVEANMECGDDNEGHLHLPLPLPRTSSSTSIVADKNANDTTSDSSSRDFNCASIGSGRDDGQTSLAARKTAALTLLHLRQQEEEKEEAAAAAAAAAAAYSSAKRPESPSSSLSSPVSPPPTSGQPSPTLSAVVTTTNLRRGTTTATAATDTTEPLAPPPSPSSNYLGSPISTSIASSSSSSSFSPSTSCNGTRENSVVANEMTRYAGQEADADGRRHCDGDADDEDDYEHEQQHRRKRRRLLLVGRAKSF